MDTAGTIVNLYRGKNGHLPQINTWHTNLEGKMDKFNYLKIINYSSKKYKKLEK